MELKNAITLILGLLATGFLFSSEVSARDLTDTSSKTKNVIVEKKIGAVYGYGGYDGGYLGIGAGFPGNNGGFFRGYPGNGGRYIGVYPYNNGGYAYGFPINFDGYYRGYYPGIGVEYRGNPGGYNVGYGGGYPGSIGSYNGDRYIGSHSGEVVDEKTEDNTHN